MYNKEDLQNYKAILRKISAHPHTPIINICRVVKQKPTVATEKTRTAHKTAAGTKRKSWENTLLSAGTASFSLRKLIFCYQRHRRFLHQWLRSDTEQPNQNRCAETISQRWGIRTGQCSPFSTLGRCHKWAPHCASQSTQIISKYKYIFTIVLFSLMLSSSRDFEKSNPT